MFKIKTTRHDFLTVSSIYFLKLYSYSQREKKSKESFVKKFSLNIKKRQRAKCCRIFINNVSGVHENLRIFRVIRFVNQVISFIWGRFFRKYLDYIDLEKHWNYYPQFKPGNGDGYTIIQRSKDRGIFKVSKDREDTERKIRIKTWNCIYIMYETRPILLL